MTDQQDSGEELATFGGTATLSRAGKNWVVSCKKGLWSVEAPTLSEARKEAFHYFLQYLEEGEYD